MTGRRRFPIRLKLTIGTLVPLLVAIFICWITGMSIIANRIIRQAQEKVRTDLNAAHEIYLNEIEHIEDIVKFTGQAPYAGTAFSGGTGEMKKLLAPLLGNENLDFLCAINREGRVIFRPANPLKHGDRLQNPLIARALHGEVASGTLILPYSAMIAENPAVAERAVISVQPTLRGRRYSKTEERSGMFLVAAAPVRDAGGTVVGALYGGILLNRNNAMVDRIKRIVYEGEPFEGKNIGTATIFLEDVRIATNVLSEAGERAIGTQLSEEVYRRVIINGERWISRAFVVNDWYFSAYQPIKDPEGKNIGSLYVGVLEKPFSNLKMKINLIFAAVLFLGSLIGLLLSGYIASRLARPIRNLESGARRITEGEKNVEIGIESADEIGDLAAEFNQMARSLFQREGEITQLNRELERKVLERTAELEEKNMILEKTQRELVRAEKLADLGILAAGVAHEINNPMAIIRGNTELLQMEIPGTHAAREEVDTIAAQVVRVERIVANLLQFARQQRMQVGKVRLHHLLDEILRQVGHQVPLSGITFDTRYDEKLPDIEGDELQLRQVFTNLILNGIQAIRGTGGLTITTATQGPDLCQVTIADTGVGIPAADQEKIFNPFFTTRGNGTGLGLSVSYGIIKDHGGSIEVASEPGKGTSFRVTLPIHQSR